MTKTMYKAYLDSIEEKKVIRETDKTVWFLIGNTTTMRERKVTNDYGWFDTWDEAKEFIVNYYECKVQAANKQFNNALVKLQKAKELTQGYD